jgi:hypothetical protein
MVGGFVAPGRVPELGRFLAAHERALAATLLEDGWPEPEARVVVGKLREAVADAEAHSLAFCEASEVYSAPMGVMN